jgi:hypothetical protein
MAQNQADEAKRQQWFAEKHKEKTMMRLCDDKQRKIMTILEKAKYWDEEYAFVRTCGRDAQNQIRIRNARAARVRTFTVGIRQRLSSCCSSN